MKHMPCNVDPRVPDAQASNLTNERLARNALPNAKVILHQVPLQKVGVRSDNLKVDDHLTSGTGV